MISMSKYNLFRKMDSAGGAVKKAKAANFIENSLSSTTIEHLRLDETKKVVLTRDHKEGNIEIILFTYPVEKEKKVEVGDYIKHKHKNFLTFMEYDHPLSNDYYKYKILECNIIIKVDDLELPAAYFSGMRKFINSTSSNAEGLTSIFENAKPIVVVKDDPMLKVNFRFLAANEAYKVINIDRISNPGIAYLSVEAVPLNVMTDDLEEGKVITYEPKEIEPRLEPVYKKGEIISLGIIDGFVSFEPSVEVMTRNRNEVIFRVPYDINKLIVKTKDTDGNIITDSREVV